MKTMRFKTMRFLVLVLAFGFGSAFAASDLLEGYKAVSKHLDAAKTTLSASGAEASASLNSASAELRLLNSQIDTPELYEGATQALNAAITAVSRRSAPDLAAQSTQVRSILQRVMYERYFTELAAGRAAAASKYGNFLAQVLGLDANNKTALQNASKNADAARARVILERGVAGLVQTDLRQANTADRTKAFQALARASGRFLLVQDSPRAIAAGLNSAAFAETINATVKGQNKEKLQSLKASIAAFIGKLKTLPAAKATVAKNLKPVATKPIAVKTVAAKPLTTKPAAKPVATKTVTTKPSTTVEIKKPKVQLPVIQKPTLQKPVAQKPNIKQITPMMPATVALGSAAIAGISNELKRSGLNTSQAQKIAAGIAGKYPNLKAVQDDIMAGLGRAAAQAQSGPALNAQESLAQTRNQFDHYLRPALKAVDPSLAERISKTFDATQNAFGLRSSDINVLQGELLAAEQVLAGKPNNGLQAVNAAALPIWAGLLRGLLLLIAAAAFAYPLYLLNLAFGGRNPYWRQIAWAITLLILPAIFEGLAWLGSLLAKLTGMAALDGLSAFSLLHNPIAQIAWALVMVASVVLATLGFRGIATQFGLIQPRGVQSENFDITSSDSLATVVAPTAVMVPNQTTNGGEKIYEWDEEF